MDDFDFQDPPRQTRSKPVIVWNILTGLVLLTTLCLAALFLMIIINPYSGLNPFPPATLPSLLAFPTPTPTPRGVLPPTWTPLPTSAPTSTHTPRPTDPETPTQTPPPEEPALTETPFALFTSAAGAEATVTPGGMPFVLSQGSPVALSSIAFHPEDGCDWMGVAGQVVNIEGAPVSTGVVIKAGGLLDGETRDITSLTGVAPQYGPAGFEIYLADHPVASQNTLWVQLLDQAGLPLSEKIFFNTYEDCEKNLIFINFKQAY